MLLLWGMMGTVEKDVSTWFRVVKWVGVVLGN